MLHECVIFNLPFNALQYNITQTISIHSTLLHNIQLDNRWKQIHRSSIEQNFFPMSRWSQL